MQMQTEGELLFRGPFCIIMLRYEYPLGYRIKFQLPFNNIKWLSDYSRRWQVEGYKVIIKNGALHFQSEYLGKKQVHNVTTFQPF